MSRLRRGSGPAQGRRYPGRKLEVTAVTSAIMPVGSWAHLHLLRAGPAHWQLALLEVIMPGWPAALRLAPVNASESLRSTGHLNFSIRVSPRLPHPSQPESPRVGHGHCQSTVTSRGPIIISPGARTDDSDGHWHTRAQRHCCTGPGGRAHSDVTVSPTVRVRVTESSCLTELQVLQVPGLPGARRRAGPVGRAGPAAAEPGSESG